MTTSVASGFIPYLARLAEHDPGALAVLRRSASFALGAYPPAFPYVEPFVANEHAQGRRRLALYLVATMFALAPAHTPDCSLARAFAELMHQRQSPSLEKRFIALLAAEPDDLPVHLRNVVSLLASAGLGFDFARLETDLIYWMDAFNGEARDRVRQQWARDFYRAAVPHD